MEQTDQDQQQPQAGKRSPAEQARFWLQELDKAKRDAKNWHDRGDKIIRRYRDRRDNDSPYDTKQSAHRMNILWANVETLKPSLYAQLPKPNVTRRWKDKSPVGRIAAMVLERALEYSISEYDFDAKMRQVVADYLLPGRGQLWVKYEADVQGDVVSNERAVCDYLHWKDYLTNCARTPDEVWWHARRDYLTRRELVARWPKAGHKVTLDVRGPETPENENQADQFHKATVWTIWSKRDKAVFYIAPGYKDAPLEVLDPPPINFDEFFPCPRACSATTASDSTLPTPDFVLYQDQANEIDTLTQRINLLSKALKVRGVYNGELGATFATLLNDTDENGLIPVDSWSMFGQNGGLKGNMDWVPLKDVVDALRQCFEAREMAKQALYEVTGIGDVIRGASNPNETATAQSIKSQWGSLRIRDRQHEIQRFARDVLRLKAEIIAEHFQVDTLRDISGVKLPTPEEKMAAQAQLQQLQTPPQPAMPGAPPQPAPDPKMIEQLQKVVASPTWDDVMALLKDERLRGMVIDVETDSTIEADQEQERTGAVEFVGAVTQFLTQAGEILPNAPMLAPMMGELLMFAVRRFENGNQLEDSIEQGMAAVSEALSQPKGPDPETEKAKAEIAIKQEATKADIANKQAKTQADIQLAQAKAGADVMIKQQGMAHDHQMAEANAAHEQTMTENAPSDGSPPRSPDPMAVLAQQMQGVLKAIAAPKRVVRDPATGKAIGIEPVVLN